MTPADKLHFEDEKDKAWHLGISEGLEQASKFLMEEAGNRFKQGFDQDAKLLRGLSKRFHEDSKKAHPRSDKK